jgi:hypothetical protein
VWKLAAFIRTDHRVKPDDDEKAATLTGYPASNSVCVRFARASILFLSSMKKTIIIVFLNGKPAALRTMENPACESITHTLFFKKIE